MQDIEVVPLRDRSSLHAPPIFWKALCQLRNMLMPIRASMHLCSPFLPPPNSFRDAFDIVDSYLARVEADGWLEFEESEEQES